MGRRHLAECRLVRGEDLLQESGIGAYRAPRFATNLREIVLRQWW